MSCFYSSNLTNQEKQTFVAASTLVNFKQGGKRQTEKDSHLSCFDKFVALRGSPYNPETAYEVTSW